MPKYQFYCDDDIWEEWKETVPRNKSLEQRLIELIKADTEGGVPGAGRITVSDDTSSSPKLEVKESGPFADIDYPSGVDDDEARAAIDASRTFIEREGPATKSEIVRAVMPDHELKYNSAEAIEKLDGGERYRGAWWRRVIKPGLEALEDVEKPTGGNRDWRVR